MQNITTREFADIAKSKIILLWGAGEQSEICVRYIMEKTNAEIHLFDSDEKKAGLSVEGITVEKGINFKGYLGGGDCAVLISSVNYQYAIAKMLTEEYDVSANMLYGYTNDFYEKNVFRKDFSHDLETRIENIRNMISDQESKEYFDASIRYRFNRNPLELVPNIKMKRIGEYADFVRVYEGDTIVDCGAYTGDTAEMYSGYVGNRCKVYAFEPFRESFEKLQQRIEEKHLSNVSALNYAVSNENRVDKICFDVNDQGIAMRIGEREAEETETVEVRTIDTVLKECESVDFIKMDIEGEEINALEGAVNIISKFNPDVMISAYHKFEHILEIPQFLKGVNPNYKIYVGHAPNVSTEIEIYATIK